MRTFIAIELPKEIKDFLSRIQERLRASGADVKWVQPENIHLTLKFLGEIDGEKLEKIIRILEDACGQKTSFPMRMAGVGAFPKIKIPRIIWVGVDKGGSEAEEIAGVLEEEITKLGIPAEEKKFSAHITVGRSRSGLNRQKLIQEIENLKDNFERGTCEFRVLKISLFKSTLTPKGPIYEVLKESNLKAV